MSVFPLHLNGTYASCLSFSLFLNATHTEYLSVSVSVYLWNGTNTRCLFSLPLRQAETKCQSFVLYLQRTETERLFFWLSLRKQKQQIYFHAISGHTPEAKCLAVSKQKDTSIQSGFCFLQTELKENVYLFIFEPITNKQNVCLSVYLGTEL